MMSATKTARRWKADWWLVSVLLLSVLMSMPFLRAVYALADEGILLNGAARTMHGEILYKDFFEFLPPGGFILTAWWFSLAGVSILSARLLAMLVILSTTCFTFLAARQATRTELLSFVLTVGWSAASQGPDVNQPSHHWFTTMFSMVAYWAALVSLRQPRLWPIWGFLSGATAGAAVMVTPTCGALAWLAAASFFARQGWLKFLAYLAASAVAPAFLLANLIAHHDLTFAYADCIRWTASHYASIQGVPFGFGRNPQNYPLFYIFPLAALLTFIVCIVNGRSCFSDQRLHLCLAFAVAGFIGSFPRPGITNIGHEAPLVLPLFAYSASSLAQRWRPIFASIALATLVTLCLPSLFAYFFMADKSLVPPLTPTPRGAIALIGQPGAAAMLERLAAISRDQSFFFYPYMPLMSFLAAREQVSGYEIFTPDYTPPSQYKAACLAVMQHANWVVIDRKWTPAYWKIVFPAMQNPSPPETQAFEHALDRGFDLAAEDKPYELRHRNANASIALCTDIAG